MPRRGTDAGMFTPACCSNYGRARTGDSADDWTSSHRSSRMRF